MAKEHISGPSKSTKDLGKNKYFNFYNCTYYFISNKKIFNLEKEGKISKPNLSSGKREKI